MNKSVSFLAIVYALNESIENGSLYILNKEQEDKLKKDFNINALTAEQAALILQNEYQRVVRDGINSESYHYFDVLNDCFRAAYGKDCFSEFSLNALKKLKKD